MLDRDRGSLRRSSRAVLDPAGSPPGMFTPELADRRLNLGGGLMGAGRWAVRSVGESTETAGLVARDPGVDALTRDPEAPGNLRDLPTILHDRQHRLVPLFHDAELHQHGPPPR